MSPTTFLKGSLNLEKITTITIPSASSTLCYTAFGMGKPARKIQSKNISSLRKGVGISTWAMKKPGCNRGFVGHYTTQLSGDYNKPSHGWKTTIRMLQTIPIWCNGTISCQKYHKLYHLERIDGATPISLGLSWPRKQIATWPLKGLAILRTLPPSIKRVHSPFHWRVQSLIIRECIVLTINP